MYITDQELRIPEDVLTRLTDDEGAGGPDYTRISDAIESAQGVVDAALAVRYAVPLASPPELIRKLTRDIAIRELYMRIGHVPDAVRTAHESAGIMLADISTGTLVPPGLSTGGKPKISGPDREFTREYMEDM
jgi:phage gp36-like protein